MAVAGISGGAWRLAESHDPFSPLTRSKKFGLLRRRRKAERNIFEDARDFNLFFPPLLSRPPTPHLESHLTLTTMDIDHVPTDARSKEVVRLWRAWRTIHEMVADRVRLS